jgi:predicted O-methyltransferase YrrM
MSERPPTSRTSSDGASPGIDTHAYLRVLRKMHEAARPRTYVEIGVFTGLSLRLADPATRAIGIDPMPRVEGPLPAGWQLFAETSDEFFARPDVDRVLGVVDVAFVDGLHHFEQALRDLLNLEPHMAPGGVILVHDCLPPDEQSAARVQQPNCWAGDVWKMMPILREHRADLRVEIAAAPPTGLGIVTGFDRDRQGSPQDLDAVVARYYDAPFDPLPATLDGRWQSIAPLFPVYRTRSLAEQATLWTHRARAAARRVTKRSTGKRAS